VQGVMTRQPLKENVYCCAGVTSHTTEQRALGTMRNASVPHLLNMPSAQREDLKEAGCSCCTLGSLEVPGPGHLHMQQMPIGCVGSM
jgi:hypothetical protein